MEDEDFINIETIHLNGKPTIKVDDTYINSFNGSHIDYLSDSFSDTSSSSSSSASSPDDGQTIVEPPLSLPPIMKPKMWVAQDNMIIVNMKTHLTYNSQLYCSDVGKIPLVISDMYHMYLNELPMELKFEYMQYILNWLNETFYFQSYNENKVNLTNVVYRHIIKEYEGLKLSPILPYNENNIYRDAPIGLDIFIDNFLRGDNIFFIRNVFELIVILMKLVNKFDLDQFQKKLYVMHVVKLMAPRDIFPNEFECLLMKKATYLYSNFIDMILINNRNIMDKYQTRRCLDYGCLNALRNLFSGGPEYH